MESVRVILQLLSGKISSLPLYQETLNGGVPRSTPAKVTVAPGRTSTTSGFSTNDGGSKI